MKIKEANKVPMGDRISAHIFGLPCVSTAYKNVRGGITYLVDGSVARGGDWVVQYEDGTWDVLSDEQYKPWAELKRIGHERTDKNYPRGC